MKRTRAGNKLKNNQPEVFEKLAKAMELSHGKVDTDFSLNLAKLEAASAEDVARLFQPQEEGHTYYDRVWEHDETRGKELRQQNFQNAFKYSLRDSFIYRYLVKLGLKDKIDACDLDEYESKSWEKKMAVNDDYHKQPIEKIRSGYSSEVYNLIKTVFSAPQQAREGIFGDKELLNIWATGEEHEPSAPYYSAKEGSIPQDKREKYQQNLSKWYHEKRGKEVLMLKNAPQEIRTKITEKIEKDKEERKKGEHRCWNYCGDYKYVALADIWYNNDRLSPWELEKELEFEDFYKALEYMGLGIAMLGGTRLEYRKNIRQFVTHLNASTRRFVADIKAGHSVKNVRALLIDDLNGWLKERVEHEWRVFEVTNAPTSYPDIKVKGSKAVKNQDEITNKVLREFIAKRKAAKAQE